MDDIYKLYAIVPNIKPIMKICNVFPLSRQQIFMKRYFYMRDVKEIASELGIGVSNVKVSLMRIRSELREFLESRGIAV